MLRKLTSTLIALLILGGMVSPLMAIEGSSNTGNTQQSQQQNTEPNYWTKEKMQNAKPQIMIDNSGHGNQYNQNQTQGQNTGAGGAGQGWRVRTIDEVGQNEEVQSSQFDDGTVVEDGKRCGEFQDVSIDDKLCKYLRKAKENSVIAQNARFHSNAPISRAQFAALVVRAFKLEANTEAEDKFVDVTTENTFYKEIMVLKTLDIVSGAEVNGQLRFGPQWPITRGQAIKILVNTLEQSGLFEFEDVDATTMTEDEDIDEEDDDNSGSDHEEDEEDDDNSGSDHEDEDEDDGDVQGAEDESLNTVYKDENIDNDEFAKFIKKLHKAETKMPEPIVKGYSDGYIRTGRLVSRLEAVVMITRAMLAAGLIEKVEDWVPMPSVTPKPSVSPKPSPSVTPVHDDDLRVIVEMSDFKFSPSVIEVAAGQKVKMKLVNKGGEHRFIINEEGLKVETPKVLQWHYVEFRIPENATIGTEYEYYCPMGDHKTQGMVGVLKVVADDDSDM